MPTQWALADQHQDRWLFAAFRAAVIERGMSAQQKIRILDWKQIADKQQQGRIIELQFFAGIMVIAGVEQSGVDPVVDHLELVRTGAGFAQPAGQITAATDHRIAAVDGVDNLWVGHFDLTQSMGIPGQFQDDRFLQALDIVVEAAHKNGKTAGIQPGNMEQAEQWIDRGFNVISWTSDYQVYRRALQNEVGALRAKLNQ